MKRFTFSQILTLFLLFSFLGCETINPLCTENFCVEGEIYPKSELRVGAEYGELPVDDADIFATLARTPLTDGEDDEPVITSGTTHVLRPTTTPPATQTPRPVEPPIVVEEPVVVEEPKVSFKDDIQPILAERCAIPGCHAAPGAGGLNLSQYDTLKRGGNGGVAFAAGNGNGSLIVKRIDRGGMPLIPPPLTAEEIQLFIDWINEGAENN